MMTLGPHPGVAPPVCPAAVGGAAARTLAIHVVMSLERYPSGTRPAHRAAAAGRAGAGPCRPAAGELTARAAAAAGDLTNRPQWRVNTCGSGRQASRPARTTASVAPCGGSAPLAAARHPRPAAGKRGQGRPAW